MRPHDDGRYHGIKVYKIYSPTSGNWSDYKFNPQYIEWYKKQDPITQTWEHHSVMSKIHPDLDHTVHKQDTYDYYHNIFLSPSKIISFNRRGRYEPWF